MSKATSQCHTSIKFSATQTSTCVTTRRKHLRKEPFKPKKSRQFGIKKEKQKLPGSSSFRLTRRGAKLREFSLRSFKLT